MTAKITNLRAERQKRRDKTGWSLAEIEKRLAERRALHEQSARKEPESLASGDMDKLLRGDDDEQE